MEKMQKRPSLDLNSKHKMFGRYSKLLVVQFQNPINYFLRNYVEAVELSLRRWNHDRESVGSILGLGNA